MASEEPLPKRARRGSGAVTLHDVARLAGVAPISASRAINTPERVSAELLDKVRNAVVRTGYVPNRLAGGLASTRSRLVAAVVPTLGSMVFMRTLQALDDALAAHDHQLMIGQAGYGAGREDELLDALIGRRPAGIVLTGVMHSAVGRQRLRACGIPVVETWDLTSDPIDMLVGFSHADVGRAVANCLHNRGRRRLAVVTGDDERALRRQAAYCEQALTLGLPTVRVETVRAPATLGNGRTALAQLLAGRGGIDAIFCSSDLLALGVATEARARGIAIPGDIALIGFGDLEFAADLEPALTTVQINGAAIGQQAAAFLLARTEGRELASRVVDIGFSIVERASA